MFYNIEYEQTIELNQNIRGVMMNEIERKEKAKQYLVLRNVIGFLGCLLPVTSLLGALMSPNIQYSDWWTSISITYYSTPVLIAILSSVSIFLISYRGYNIWDTVINTIAGICGLGVVSFPCEASWLDGSTKVGYFWLPIDVTKWFHYTFAAILFLMLAVNSLWLFSKGDNFIKRLIYKLCGWTILISFVIFSINAIFINYKPLIIILETVMLFAFGVSWLVKGHMFDKILKD